MERFPFLCSWAKPLHIIRRIWITFGYETVQHTSIVQPRKGNKIKFNLARILRVDGTSEDKQQPKEYNTTKYFGYKVQEGIFNEVWAFWELL